LPPKIKALITRKDTLAARRWLRCVVGQSAIGKGFFACLAVRQSVMRCLNSGKENSLKLATHHFLDHVQQKPAAIGLLTWLSDCEFCLDTVAAQVIP
jgi:hypothetical protein